MAALESRLAIITWVLARIPIGICRVRAEDRVLARALPTRP
jgi:hypothetical protein